MKIKISFDQMKQILEETIDKWQDCIIEEVALNDFGNNIIVYCNKGKTIKNHFCYTMSKDNCSLIIGYYPYDETVNFKCYVQNKVNYKEWETLLNRIKKLSGGKEDKNHDEFSWCSE